MIFKAPIWILTFLLSTSLFASEYKEDSGVVKNYLEKTIYYHLANTITDESVQQELIDLLNSLGKKEFQILVSPNETEFVAKNILNQSCGCEAVVVSLSHFNDDLLSDFLLEYNHLKVRKELESLDKKALDLENSPYLKAALSFYMEFKPQVKSNKAIRAGVPSKDKIATSNDEIAKHIANVLSNEQDIYFNEKLVQIFSLKAQSTSLRDFLTELRKNKNLEAEFNKLNQKEETQIKKEIIQEKKEEKKSEGSYFIKFSDEENR